MHSVDAPHEHVLRSIALFADEVAPALGYALTPTPPRTSTDQNLTLKENA